MLWHTALYLIFFSAYVVGGIVGVLLYPRPASSFTRFLLLVIVGVLFTLVALYNPCMRDEGSKSNDTCTLPQGEDGILLTTSNSVHGQCRSAVLFGG